MGAGGEEHQLRYRVSEVSGEDPEHPATELLVHTQHTRGWHSPRLGSYPQSVTLTLEHPARLRQIQLLAHEFKIPSKVELYVHSDGASRRLGHLAFASNEESSFRARELRSVPVDIAHALSLTIVAHPNYVNHLNVYNQIALIAVNLIGEPEHSQPSESNASAPLPQSHEVSASQASHNHGIHTALFSKNRLHNADVGLDAQVDERTAAQIRQLQEQKVRAVQSEDYDEAKRLKQAVQHLKEAGHKLLELERSKLEAVKEEDYDEAKRFKLEIDHLRSAAEASMQPLQQHQDRYVTQSPQIEQQQKQHLYPSPNGQPSLPNQNQYAYQDVQQTATYQPQPQAEQPRNVSAAAPLQPTPFEGAVDHDEKPAVGSAAQEEFAAPSNFRRNSSTHSAGGEQQVTPPSRVVSYPEPPAEETVATDQNHGLEEPEQMSSEAEREFGGIIPIAGEREARCLASRSWEMRDAAARRLTERVQQKIELGDDMREVVRPIGKALGRLLKDRVPAAFSSATALTVAVASLAPSVGQREARDSLTDAIATLCERIGDSNGRIRESASSALTELASESRVGPTVPSHHALRVPKSMQQHKLVIARLQISRRLLQMHGFGEGLTVAQLVQFAGKMLESSSGDVRSEAIGAIQDAQARAGKQPVSKHLPSNLKPQIKAAIDGETQHREEPQATPSPGATASTATSQERQGRQQHQQHQQQQQQQRRQQPQTQQQQNQQEDQQEGSRVGINDLKKEVQAREKQLGSEHQDVAAALVELAGAESEEECFAEAQKDYERALAIQEKQLGPNHADTVQTVTDVAICYLDQGKNEQGRPLLERALREQEHQLGPDHEDVQAIRDVLTNLNEEEGR